MTGVTSSLTPAKASGGPSRSAWSNAPLWGCALVVATQELCTPGTSSRSTVAVLIEVATVALAESDGDLEVTGSGERRFAASVCRASNGVGALERRIAEFCS
jgi:hypothetical protein